MIIAAVGMRREANLVERHGQALGIRAVPGGGRADLLATRLEAALKGADAQGVLSIGLGGALDPALEVGDVVIASEVLRPRRRWDTDAAWRDRLIARLPKARVGAVYGSNDMVLHTLDKAKLRGQGGAMLVDMESHVAAKVAATAGVPFAVVRVVSDKAGVSLPPAVLAGISEDGDMDLIGVLSALVRDPVQLPALMRTGQDAGRAFKVLAAVAERALKA